MSTQITTAFVNQFSSNITMLSQQMGSLLREAVDVETVTGEKAFFDQVGSASTGKTGSTSTALPAGQKIADGSAGLTQAKLVSAKKILDQNSVDPSIQRYIIVSPEQIEDLLNITSVTSADFNTVRALVQGEVDTFVGFKFIVSNRLNTDSDGNRQVIAFAGDGIKLAVGKDVTGRIDERSDKSYSTQIYYCMDIGATRMEEEKVIEIKCSE